MQPLGYRAFIPKPLPPEPPLAMDEEIVHLLSRADRSLGRLDGITDILPNPDLFVAMYVRKEAVLSSQIEGTESSLRHVLQYEAGIRGRNLPADVGEVVNYVRAMNYGLDRLKKLPLSLRLIREIHSELLSGVRGSKRGPGEFRTSQNWIGPPGCDLKSATFVPPPPHRMSEALSDLEKFLYDDSPRPPLITCALVHCQFETIHPFLDGNGRLGRLLITFLLCQRGELRRPLLYLSHYFKQHRQAYYNHLMAVRDSGDWEAWVKFFLRAIWEVSDEAVETSRRILRLEGEHRSLVQERVRGTKGPELLTLLFERPFMSIHEVHERLGVCFATASKLVSEFEKTGILREVTGNRRNRLFSYTSYVDLLRPGTEPYIAAD